MLKSHSISFWCLLGAMPFLAACAHISSVLPSLGHIDSQVQIQNQTPVKPNPNAASVYQKPLSQTPYTEQKELNAAYIIDL